MELRELRSFCTAAKVGGISRAALQLGLGQPTVTTHIRKLEEEMGTILFDRSRRPIRLTPSGTALLELAAPLIEGIDDLMESTSQTEQESLITVGTTNDMVGHTLLRTVTVFLTRYPHSRLRIRAANMSDIVESVRTGEIDVGLVPYPGRSEELDFTGLFAYERVLITPLNHPLLEEEVVTFEHIAEWPLILRGGMTLTRSMLESEFKRRGLSYEVLVELDGMDFIKRYVAMGMGISVGPRLAIEPEDERTLGIVNLANLLPIEQSGILTLRGRTLSTPAQLFTQVMRDTLMRRR